MATMYACFGIVFNTVVAFNGDLSKWQTGKVVDMAFSKH